jgi:ubiquinone biosynthesis protein UbiJ
MTFMVVVTPGRIARSGGLRCTARLVIGPVTEESPFAIAQELIAGDKPAVRIEGDVQLAAEVNWLIDHVRWDIEEDLARLMGDARPYVGAGCTEYGPCGPAQFVGQRSPSAPGGPTA